MICAQLTFIMHDASLLAKGAAVRERRKVAGSSDIIRGKERYLTGDGSDQHSPHNIAGWWTEHRDTMQAVTALLPDHLQPKGF